MLVAAMQPTYLPWLGYFDLLDQVNLFVLLESVQFEKQSWQQRNRLRTPNGLEWLTVPVLISGRFGQCIDSVQIKVGEFPTKHLKTVRQHYGRCKYFEQYWPEFQRIMLEAEEHASLAELNIWLLRWLADCLGITTPIMRTTEVYRGNASRSDRLVEILQRVGADVYLSPRGSLEYLEADREVFSRAGIPVVFQTFDHPTYLQRYQPFMVGASAIDLLFNEGPGALSIIRSGRRQSESLDDIIQKKDMVDEARQ